MYTNIYSNSESYKLIQLTLFPQIKIAPLSSSVLQSDMEGSVTFSTMVLTRFE